MEVGVNAFICLRSFGPEMLKNVINLVKNYHSTKSKLELKNCKSGSIFADIKCILLRQSTILNFTSSAKTNEN